MYPTLLWYNAEFVINLPPIFIYFLSKVHKNYDKDSSSSIDAHQLSYLKHKNEFNWLICILWVKTDSRNYFLEIFFCIIYFINLLLV